MTQPDPAAFWDQRYADARVSFGTEPNVYLASQAGLFKAGQRVLVPGDGEGRNGVWLAQHGLKRQPCARRCSSHGWSAARNSGAQITAT